MADEPKPFSRTAEELVAALRRLPFDEPERMRRRPTKPVANLVEDLLVQYQVGRASPEQSIRDNWVTIVGAANAQYSHAAQIDGRGKLTILAGHSVVRNELFLHRKLIVERIRQLPGCGHVRDIFLRAG